MSAFIGKRPFIHQAIEYENAAPISSIISLFAFHAWKVALPILGCFLLKFWVERKKYLKIEQEESKVKKLISVIMTMIMVMGTATMGFAEVDIALKVNKYISETEQGVYINEKYYTFGEFEKLLDTATEIEQQL